VDLRHLLDEQGLFGARRRHGEAARGRRLARADRGHGPGRRFLHPRGDAQARRAG
jgi:hypothetical protein